MNSDRRPGSRMPHDPAYWQDLAARSIDAALEASAEVSDVAQQGVVAAGAGVPATAVPGVAAPWWHSLSDAAFMLAASALLALLGGTQLVVDRSPAATTKTHVISNAIVPDDDLVATLANAAEPPPAMALLRVVARREVER